MPNIVQKIREFKKEKAQVIYTRDTHSNKYLNTQEGEKLPIPHCISGEEGWELINEIKSISKNEIVVNKPTFGSLALSQYILPNTDEIVLIGFCTDICVISNALILKSQFPEIKIVVDASCCAGVTPEKHKHALDIMKSCQIDIANEE